MCLMTRFLPDDVLANWDHSPQVLGSSPSENTWMTWGMVTPVPASSEVSVNYVFAPNAAMSMWPPPWMRSPPTMWSPPSMQSPPSVQSLQGDSSRELAHLTGSSRPISVDSTVCGSMGS